MRRGPNSLLYHGSQNLSRVFAKIFIFLFFPKCLTSIGGCGIIIMSGGETPHTKPTDTNCRMVNGQAEGGRLFQKIFQNFLKKVLTRLAECAIISM